MVESQKPKKELHLVWVHSTVEILRCSQTKDSDEAILLSAEASLAEKPGAVIPHAGICEGAVGQLAVLP